MTMTSNAYKRLHLLEVRCSVQLTCVKHHRNELSEQTTANLEANHVVNSRTNPAA